MREPASALPPDTSTTNRLAVAIVQDQDAVRLSAALVRAGFPHTRLSTTGGFLLRSNVAFLVAFAHQRGDDLVAVIARHCQTRTEFRFVAWGDEFALASEPVEVRVGGATVITFELERFERLDGATVAPSAPPVDRPARRP